MTEARLVTTIESLATQMIEIHGVEHSADEVCRAPVLHEVIRRILPAAAPAEGLLTIVKRTARMGLCSQTHHEHLMHEARAALARHESGSEK